MSDNNGDRTPAPENPPEDAPRALTDAAYEAIRAELLRGMDMYRLPPELMEQILKELPPPEERERMYRELIEQGGHTFEELIASLPEDLRAGLDERAK